MKHGGNGESLWKSATALVLAERTWREKGNRKLRVRDDINKEERAVGSRCKSVACLGMSGTVTCRNTPDTPDLVRIELGAGWCFPSPMLHRQK